MRCSSTSVGFTGTPRTTNFMHHSVSPTLTPVFVPLSHIPRSLQWCENPPFTCLCRRRRPVAFPGRLCTVISHSSFLAMTRKPRFTCLYRGRRPVAFPGCRRVPVLRQGGPGGPGKGCGRHREARVGQRWAPRCRELQQHPARDGVLHEPGGELGHAVRALLLRGGRRLLVCYCTVRTGVLLQAEHYLH
jgi:hypothetical protein